MLTKNQFFQKYIVETFWRYLLDSIKILSRAHWIVGLQPGMSYMEFLILGYCLFVVIGDN
jgi:hypothetical protein